MSNKTARFLSLLASTVKTNIEGETKTVINDTFPLSVGATKTYNVATLLGTQASAYDLTQMRIQLLVKDDKVGSPTNSYYIIAETVAAVGVKPNGDVMVANLYEAAAEFKLLVDVPKL